jgi:hypothetical protein
MGCYTAIAYDAGFICFRILRRQFGASLIERNMANSCLTMPVFLFFRLQDRRGLHNGDWSIEQ